jgi:hypothetical protein
MAYYDPRSNEEIRRDSLRTRETLREIAREEEQERIDVKYRRMRVEEHERQEGIRQMGRMPDLPMKPGRKLPDNRTSSERARDEWIANRTVRKSRTVPKEERKEATARKKLKASPLQGVVYKESQHPRDRFGRFAVKALKSTGKAIARTAKGTVKAVKSAHKTVKRVQAGYRKRAALEYRERKLDIHKREQAARLKRKKATRKRVRR